MREIDVIATRTTCQYTRITLEEWAVSYSSLSSSCSRSTHSWHAIEVEELCDDAGLGADDLDELRNLLASMVGLGGLVDGPSGGAMAGSVTGYSKGTGHGKDEIAEEGDESC